MYRISTQMDMSFSTIAQWENSFPLNALVPCSIPTQAASGRRPEVDETEYWRKASSKEVGHLAPEPFYSFSSSSFWSPLREERALPSRCWVLHWKPRVVRRNHLREKKSALWKYTAKAPSVPPKVPPPPPEHLPTSMNAHLLII